jgi:hypothetical protein
MPRMARRMHTSAWVKSFQRSVATMTRNSLRAGTRAMDQALKPSVEKRRPPPGVGDWIAGLVAGPAPLSSLPPARRIHGGDDTVVSANNGHAAARVWASAAGARAVKPRSVQRGKRYAMTVTDFKRRRSTVATLVEVGQLGHAWSGGATTQPFGDGQGPDASRMVWAFAAKQFRVCVCALSHSARAYTDPVEGWRYAWPWLPTRDRTGCLRRCPMPNGRAGCRSSNPWTCRSARCSTSPAPD